MSIEIGRVYHVKKFEELPEEFPKCGLGHGFYEDHLCDTVVKTLEGETFSDPDWGTFYRCISCGPKKDWVFPFYINESLLEEIHDEKTDRWMGYFAYLKEWMEEHDGVEFYGTSPASFDKWIENEKEE